MNRKILAMASTTYQLIVFLFLKQAFLTEDIVDLVVTDKTALLEKLYLNGRLTPLFHEVYFADARKIKNPYKSGLQNLFESFIYNRTTNKILSAPLDTYDEVFYACPENPDEIIKELSKTLIKRNHHILFHRYEDGFASYTRFSGHIITSKTGVKLYDKFLGFHQEVQEDDLYLFEPELASPNINWNIVKIPNRNEQVLTMIRSIFEYNPEPFPEKFVFLGQGTSNGIDNAETYRSLVNYMIEEIGTDNLLLKRHPRGVYDVYSENVHTLDTDCPWEVFELNGSMDEKVLISYYSTACITGKTLFNSKSKVIFLYPLAEDSFSEEINFEFYFEVAARKYPGIYIARSKEELSYLIKKLSGKLESEQVNIQV